MVEEARKPQSAVGLEPWRVVAASALNAAPAWIVVRRCAEGVAPGRE